MRYCEEEMAETGFLQRSFRLGGAEVNYSVFVPHGWARQSERAGVLFLHGAGETGTDGVRPTAVGIGPAIRRREAGFPFLVAFPQSRKGSWRYDSPDAAVAMAVLDTVISEWGVRTVHLTGISMGGYGTWSLAGAFPDRWATLAPVCGGGNAGRAALIRHIPCWAFHGDADEVIPVRASREMIAALREAGAGPRYTEYPGVGHNSWDLAYGTGALYDWWSEHSR